MVCKPKITMNKAELADLYVIHGMNTRQIAERLGASPRTIARRLGEFGIQAKPQGSAPNLTLQDKDWLRTQYCDLGKSTVQIANEIGATPRTVLTWIERSGISTRPRNQHTDRKWPDSVRKNMSAAKKGRLLGEENPNWKGGKRSDYKRERNSYRAKAWSVSVRTRDGNKCVECGATGRLHAHHVKSFKHHPELRYDVSNGITLCPKCHEAEHGFKFPEWVHRTYHDEIPTSAGNAERR